MKITLFGLTLSSSWGNGHATPYRALLRALRRRGHDLVFYEKDVDYYHRRRDFSACDFCRLELYSNWEEARPRALRDAAYSDVILVGSYCPEGARISDDLLAVRAPLHVFYDLDTPITLSNLEGGDLDYLRREQIPQFDLVLSFTGGEILRQLESRWGARRARPLYGCVDPEVHRRVAAHAEFSCDLSYMGTYAADRQHKVDALFLEAARRMPQAHFVLAGSLYPWDWRWPENVRIFEHVAPAEHSRLYSSSRLTLNITRDGMARYGYCPSGRFFEAAACGTPILTDSWPGLEMFFTPGEELFTASRAEDVVAALQKSDEELARVARRARERTLCEHTGDQRAETMLRYFEEAYRGERMPASAAS